MTPRYGIQFHPCGQIYYFTSPDAVLTPGTPVVVDTGHGENLGTVIKVVRARPEAGAPYLPEDAGDGLGGRGPDLGPGLSPGLIPDQAAGPEMATGIDVGQAAGAGRGADDEAADDGANGYTGGLEVDSDSSVAGGGVSGPNGAASVLEDAHGEAESDGQELSAILTEALNPDSEHLSAIRRIAGPHDLERAEQNIAFADKAGKYCSDIAAEHRLDMKLVHTDVSLDGGKLIFFFTAPGRIDFRELVKSLARNFHARIELRQIGVRHETQLVGAIGNCGMVCCCRRYMRKFAPVTIKMAKEQGLFLNPVKISGTCGRLLCCLSFEQHNYEEFHGRCPKLGKKYETARGVFKVLRASLFRNSLTLLPEEGDELEVTLEEWAAMQPVRYDAARRQRAERAEREARDPEAAGGEAGGGDQETGERKRQNRQEGRADGRGDSPKDRDGRDGRRRDDGDGPRDRGERDSRRGERRDEAEPREGRRDARRDGQRDERRGDRDGARREETGGGRDARKDERRAERDGQRRDGPRDERRDERRDVPKSAEGENVAAPKDADLAPKDVPAAPAPKDAGAAPGPAAKDAGPGGPGKGQEIRQGTGLSRFLASASGGDDDDE